MSSPLQGVSTTNCIIHNLIENHIGDTNKIIREAKDVSKRTPPPPNFRHIPICSIGHSEALTDYTIESGEIKYAKDHPHWETESRAVPPYDLYYDKLITMRNSYIRAQDLEKLFEKLRMSVPKLQTKNFGNLSNSEVITYCQDEIWKNLQIILTSKDLAFGNAKQLKRVEKYIKSKIGYQSKPVLAHIREAVTQQKTLQDIQDQMVKILIQEECKTWGIYANRCGEMGEFAVKQTVHNQLKERNVPSLTFSGFRISTYLGEGLEKVGISITETNDAELDIAAFIPNGDKVNINFVQTKVLFPSDTEDNYEEKMIEKIRYSLMQTRKDIEAFLTVMPDFGGDELDKLTFGTLSALPMTNKSDKICDSCLKFIIFKQDLVSTTRSSSSISQTMVDIMEAQPTASSPSLANKLDLYNIQPPSSESLELFKKMSSRYVGVSSVHPMKNYETFLDKQEKQIEDLKKQAKKDPERALYLTPEQNMAIASHQYLLVGTFGAGKTTILELSLRNILDNLKKNNEPCQVFVIIWNDSKDLLSRFRQFESEGAKVFSLAEAFQHFGAEQDKDNHLKSLNNLCEAISEKCKVSPTNPVYLLTDEMTPNPKFQDPNKFDWRGVDTRGINVMLSMKPTTSSLTLNLNTYPELLSPDHIPTIHLHRVLRCTQAILNFIQGFMKASLNNWPLSLSFPLDLVTPGHEIHGELPEYVFLPPCSCNTFCDSPVDHLVTADYPTLEAILTSLVTHHSIKQQDITVLINTRRYRAAARDVLVRKLGDQYSQVKVKLLEEFRGMESPVLVYISDYVAGFVNINLGGVMEGMTRVTSRVIIVNKEVSGADALSPILQEMCNQRLAVDVTAKYKQ